MCIEWLVNLNFCLLWNNNDVDFQLSLKANFLNKHQVRTYNKNIFLINKLFQKIYYYYLIVC